MSWFWALLRLKDLINIEMEMSHGRGIGILKEKRFGLGCHVFKLRK